MKPDDEAGRTLSVQSASWQTPQKRETCSCDKGVKADKHVCEKCFKDELNAVMKDGQGAREHSEKKNGFTQSRAGICLCF